jgi:hypothetical protein
MVAKSLRRALWQRAGAGPLIQLRVRRISCLRMELKLKMVPDPQPASQANRTSGKPLRQQIFDSWRHGVAMMSVRKLRAAGSE